MSSEKRRFKRYVFPNDDRIIALLALDDEEGTIDARILNISLGGIGLAVEKTKTVSLKKEAVLFLKEVTGESRLAGLTGHSVRVKWILDYEPLNNLAIGCEFLHLDEESRLGITNLLLPD